MKISTFKQFINQVLLFFQPYKLLLFIVLIKNYNLLLPHDGDNKNNKNILKTLCFYNEIKRFLWKSCVHYMLYVRR